MACPLLLRRLAWRFAYCWPLDETGRADNAQPCARQPLDIAEVLALVRRAERNGHALGAGARRAANAVHIAFGNIRQLVVDDVRDLVDVDPTRRDVGRHQDAGKALAETVERRLALALALVAMDGVHTNADVLDGLGNAVSTALRAREHDHAPHGGILQQAGKSLALRARRNENDLLVDAVDSLAGARDLDADRILEHVSGELRDVLRHGRREEQRVALRRHELENAPHVAHEAHVEHPVGFIEDEGADLVQAQVALVDEIEQTTWRRDEDVDPARDRRHLRPLADAAEDHRVRDPHVATVGMDALADLDGKLARRRKDQRARCARLRATALGSEAMK